MTKIQVVLFLLGFLFVWACKNINNSPAKENASSIEMPSKEGSTYNSEIESFLGSYVSMDSINDIYFIKNNHNDSLLLSRYHFGHYKPVGHITWNDRFDKENTKRFLINNLQGASVPTYELYTQQEHLFLKVDSYDAITDKNVIQNYRYSKDIHDLKGDSVVRKFLSQDIYHKDLEKFSDSQRSFDYAEIDLNNDGKFEYLLTLFNMDFCGSGGCTLWVLNHKGEKISKTTQVNMPLTISTSSTNGWKDLICYSNGHHRIISFNGQEYSSNASIQTTINEEERYALNLVTLLKKFM